ncbi:MAG TPA: GNAT family N-acetyltransferase [Lysobacter sp.]|jgi:RimJ/RimL family protein N-acetyltransferase|nr:GNAT family N-acetyltransferase [Lysobacter sp.]
MRVLETARLRLRPLDATDEAFYCQLYADPVVMRHIGAPISSEAARRSLLAACRQAAHYPPHRRTWVMTEVATNVDIGLLALVNDRHAPTAEIGALLLDDQQNRGYATEAINTLVAYAFHELGLAAVYTRHTGDNALAAGLMRKLGFIPVDPDPQDGSLTYRWQLTPRAKAR